MKTVGPGAEVGAGLGQGKKAGVGAGAGVGVGPRPRAFPPPTCENSSPLGGEGWSPLPLTLGPLWPPPAWAEAGKAGGWGIPVELDPNLISHYN